VEKESPMSRAPRKRQRETVYGVHLGASVTPELSKKVEDLADAAGVSKSFVIRTMLESGYSPAKRKLLRKAGGG